MVDILRFDRWRDLDKISRVLVTMLTILDRAIVARHRRSIQNIADILADDERRTALGFTREYFEECRVERFCSLINYQIRTFDRS